MNLKLVSWNVNGLRAISAKPEWKWFSETDAQVVALQETKAIPEQLKPELTRPGGGWSASFASSQVRKGYSGVAVYSRIAPLRIVRELPDPSFQGEGRLLHLEFPDFHFFNGYFPNGGGELLDEKGRPTGRFARVHYKMGFFEAFFNYAETCRKEKPIVVCGDFNIAHKPVDLARPRQNEANTGFLPEERAFLDRFVGQGYVDTFRMVHGDQPGQYSWWSYKTHARAKNIGWRIDYFFVSEELAPAVRDAWIASDVYGSDHCPVGLELAI